jgi:HlyD family secretion protein
MIWIKRVFLVVVVLLFVAAVAAAFRPQPVRVDVGTVEEGPMEVTVRDDGRTRIKDRYVVSTPIAGRLRRIDFKAGDQVIAGETVLARMEPTAPELLDPRHLAQAQARVRAAEGRVSRARTELDRAQASLDQAQVELERQRQLEAQGATTASRLEEAQLKVRTLTEEVRAAEYQKEITQYELELERAALLHVTREKPIDNDENDLEFDIHSPISGRVLRVMQESSGVLTAGAPLLELGDPTDLEVVVDVLSSDAVRVRPGQRVLLEHWGGEEPLHAVVRLVEPSGFTKVSALGVEEQRVNVVIDFVGSLSERMTLGDGFRVEARIVVWEEDETLKVPSGALFRSDGQWAVFVVAEGRAALRPVTIGMNNGLEAQVLDGLLTAGEIR